MEIQILGTGCQKCEKLAANAGQAVSELQLDCKIKKITDINQIMAFGVMLTPALAIDGQVKVVGKVPSVADIKNLL